MCVCRPESQLYPGLHKKNRDQQVKEGDSAPLLHSRPGVLHPTLESSVQERHGLVGAGAEEGHENDQRDGTPLIWREAERVGIVQLGEGSGETLVRPFNVQRGLIRETERDFLRRPIVTEQGITVLN